MKRLEQFSQEIKQCVLCGTCKSVCPTFSVINRETASARGKVALCSAFLKGEIGLSERFTKHINECVLCGACEESCPNDVHVPDIILAARREIFKNNKVDFTRTAVSKLLGSEKIGNTVIKIASKVQNIFFKRVPEESGLHRRFPLPFINEKRLVPKLAEKFFLESVDQRSESVALGFIPNEGPLPIKGNATSPKIGFFAGCLINYIYPHIGEASLKVIEKAGASVIVPLDQSCCGMPAIGVGDIEAAKKLALKNLEAFERYELDYITTACATCGHGLKRRFKDLLGNEYPERINAFSNKVRDITELLVNELGQGGYPSGNPSEGWVGMGGGKSEIASPLIKSVARNDITPNSLVTYHDPCHLSRGQGIKDEPRKLIEMSGHKFKEMNHPCRCCGLGGSFNITNYELSMEINREKAEDIKNTGADIAATACPGCIMQIKDGLHKIGTKTKVMHVVELL
ncbi:MAG: (Fe-S)-binding protein [Deltaproteobacteria bacterium]|nr:(Fe-S)-binding protein [Deltaproteobacteria bacterium]